MTIYMTEGLTFAGALLMMWLTRYGSNALNIKAEVLVARYMTRFTARPGNKP